MLQTDFVAQDLEKAAQELGYDFSGIDKFKNERDYYGLRYEGFTVSFVNSIKEFSSKNVELQKILLIYKRTI